MSEWVFVGGAYVLTWAVLAAYRSYANACVRRAEAALAQSREDA